MNDEASEHSHHFLHRHMRVVEEGSVLMELKFVYESLACTLIGWPMPDDGCPSRDRQFEAMLPDTCRPG